VLILAGLCHAAEFKSDEAKKAQADYAAALDAAKTTYGQGLVKAKAVLDAKAAAATDAISKEALQGESAAATEELVRLRDADAAAFEPKEWKSAETKKVRAGFAADLKVAQVKYAQDLLRARQAVLTRKAAATDSAVKEALQAEIALIEEEQAGLKEGGKGAPKPVKQGAWIDLLPLIDLTRDVVKGRWESTKSGLAANGGRSQIEMPVVPFGNYELEVKFVRESGNEVNVFIPAGSRSVGLFLGAEAGSTSGMEQINGKNYKSNETTVKTVNLEYGQPYTVNIRVIADTSNAEITVSLNGKPFTKWAGPQQALSPPTWCTLRKTSYLGLGMNAQAVIQSVRLRMLSGEAKPRATSTQAEGGFSPVGEWQKTNTGTLFTFFADGRVFAPKAQDRKYAEGTWALSSGKLTITFKTAERMTFEIVNADTINAPDWQLRRQAAGK
jgi:hypothetical protein